MEEVFMNRFKKPVFLVTYGLILYFFLLRFEVFSGVMLKLLNLTKHLFGALL